MGEIHEHSVVRFENLLNEQLEPLLRQPAHVQSGLVDERNLQLLLQILLLVGYFLQRILHQMVPANADVQEEYLDLGLLMPGHLLHQRPPRRQDHLLLGVLRQDVLFGHDAQYERVLAIRKLVGPLWVLPRVVFLYIIRLNLLYSPLPVN